MAEHADDGDIFIYRGGRAPRHVAHALIDQSVDEIEDKAFYKCKRLVQVDTHDGIRKIGYCAFYSCKPLRRMNLKSVIEIDHGAFEGCDNLESVEFGVWLETIGISAFKDCISITHLKLPSIITLDVGALWQCTYLTDVEFSERLQTIEAQAFHGCERLQRVAIPLKRNLFVTDGYRYNEYNQFEGCEQLATVDLVGGIHKTVASLHMESWRAEVTAEINRINQVLPNTSAQEKAGAIRQWMHSLLDKMDHYKAEHCRYVKEGTTLLELALWKANLDDNEGGQLEREGVRTTRGRRKKARKEMRVTSGANVVIKNVLPFLQLRE